MATELLERTVIKMFDDDDVVYDCVSDDCVEMIMPTEDSLVRIHVLDHEIEPPMLTIRMVDFVRFPEAAQDYALTVCNALNRKGIGKFVLDEFGDMSFRLDFPTVDSAGPSEFRHAMILAVSWFSKMYPVVMKVRWADMTVDEALEFAEPPDDDEEDGGEGETLMTDEDIRKLLMSGGPDDDDERRTT